jgi:hypothetical protein
MVRLSYCSVIQVIQLIKALSGFSEKLRKGTYVYKYDIKDYLWYSKLSRSSLADGRQQSDENENKLDGSNKKNVDDWVFEADDKSFIDFEFQSTSQKSDLKRFMMSDAMLCHDNGRPLKTTVVYSGNIEKAKFR